MSNDILIPLENGKVVNSVAQLDSSDKEAQIMSFGMLDSFNKDNKKNRRRMWFKGWSKSERNTKKIAEKITFLRRNRLSLTYGDTEILEANKDAFVLLRDYFGEVTISVFNKSRKAETVSFDLPERFKEKILKGNFGGKVVKEGVKVSVQLAGARFDMLTD